MTVAETGRRPNSLSPDWSKLSPRGRAILGQVAIRLTAGYSYPEIAELLDTQRPVLQDLPLPKGKVTTGWVQARMRELRQELREQG